MRAKRSLSAQNSFDTRRCIQVSHAPNRFKSRSSRTWTKVKANDQFSKGQGGSWSHVENEVMNVEVMNVEQEHPLI